MSRLTRWLAPTTVASAHCDLPCGVYDPEQARIEAESCHRINEKYAANEDATSGRGRSRSRRSSAELVKHHLDVLWHDYFKPEHLEKVPNLHELFWNANKQVSKVKASTDKADSQEAARPHRRGRRGLEGDRRQREDPGHRPPRLTPSRCASRGPAERRGLVVPTLSATAARPVAPGDRQASMEPTIRAGDWLLVDPTTAAGRGAARSSPSASRRAACSRSSGWRAPGDRVPFADGFLELAEDEAWLMADADAETAEAGATASRSTRPLRPGPGRALVGRVWFRYAPLGRVGPLRRLRARPSRRRQADPRRAALLGEGGLRVGRRRPAGREADDPLHPGLAQPPSGRPAPGRRPHSSSRVYIENRSVDGSRPSARSVLGLEHPLDDLVGSRNTKLSSSAYLIA